MNKGNKIQNSRDVGEKGVFQFFSCSRLTKTTDGNHFDQTKLKKKERKRGKHKINRRASEIRTYCVQKRTYCAKQKTALLRKTKDDNPFLSTKN